jgi:hypothetical protein
MREGTQGVPIAKCFSHFSSGLQLPECLYHSIYRHDRKFYIAFIKYFEVMKCVSAHKKSLSSDL